MKDVSWKPDRNTEGGMEMEPVEFNSTQSNKDLGDSMSSEDLYGKASASREPGAQHLTRIQPPVPTLETPKGGGAGDELGVGEEYISAPDVDGGEPSRPTTPLAGAGSPTSLEVLRPGDQTR